MDKPPVTLALTHYNRFDFLLDAIAKVRDDPRIDEIVISDDKSTDKSYAKLCRRFKDDPKVRISQNTVNLDCYANKHRAVELSVNNWVILFDSDNIITPAYLDAIYKLEVWDPNTFYLPEFAEPHFDYTAFSGITISRATVSSYMDKYGFSNGMNTANYLVPREGYLRVWDGTKNPRAADSMFQAFNWLRNGGQLHFVPGMRYFHRVHRGSHFKENYQNSISLLKWVRQSLQAMH